MTSDGNNFNDFPDYQMNKFCLFIGWSQILYLTLKFVWSIALHSFHSSIYIYNGRPWQTQRTNWCVSVRLSQMEFDTYVGKRKQAYRIGQLLA